MNFNWLPILNWLQGRRVPVDGVFGQIPAGIWIEVYDGKIFAFPDQKTRHAITLADAKALYQKRQIQPTLFEM